MPDPNPRSERVLRIGPSVFLFLLALAGLGYGYARFGQYFAEKPPVTTTLGPTINQVEKLGLLTVMRVSVSDVLKMTGFNYKGAFLIKGDGLLAVDMRKLQIQDRDEAQKLVTLVLPDPEVIQPRVDHNKTMTYDVKGDWMSMIPGWGNEGKLRDAAMLEAQKLIETAVRQPEYLQQAKDNAVVMLQNMLGFTGWYVQIKWAGEEAKAKAEVTTNTTATVSAGTMPGPAVGPMTPQPVGTR